MNFHTNDGRITCPIHHRPTPGGTCQSCVDQGVFAIVCEIDKISRTVDTLTEQGYEMDPRGNASFAVLVFREKSCSTATS